MFLALWTLAVPLPTFCWQMNRIPPRFFSTIVLSGEKVPNELASQNGENIRPLYKNSGNQSSQNSIPTRDEVMNDLLQASKLVVNFKSLEKKIDRTELIEEVQRLKSLEPNAKSCPVGALAFPQAPPMTLKKYMTLTSKRVVVTISYNSGIGFKKFYDGAAMKIKQEHPDVIIQKNLIKEGTQLGTFQIDVDGKIVCMKKPGSIAVYLNMASIDAAIKLARRRRRPSQTVYGDKETAFRQKDSRRGRRRLDRRG